MLSVAGGQTNMHGILIVNNLLWVDLMCAEKMAGKMRNNKDIKYEKKNNKNFRPLTWFAFPA